MYFDLCHIFIHFSIIVSSLKCYAPKLEWVGDVPRFPRNKFELTDCNTGIQKCVGGCKHCMVVEGSYVTKSCTVEDDITLVMLGVHEAGCFNVTEEQSEKYAKWINDTIGIGAQFALNPNVTRACRCSWDGCNYSSTKVDKEILVFANNNYGKEFAGKNLVTALLVIYIITITERTTNF